MMLPRPTRTFGFDEPGDRRRERQVEPTLNTERTITTGGSGGTSAEDPSKPRLVGAVVEPVDRHRWLLPLTLAGGLVAAALGLFGLPPLDSMGWLDDLGYVAPTCGGTRSVLWLARGDLARSWSYNPLGILLAVVGLAALLRAGVGFGRGRWVNVRVGRLVIPVAIIAVTVLWANQWAHRDLILAG